MSAGVGLRDVGLPDLQQLLRGIESRKIPCPLTGTVLQSHGLGHLKERVSILQGLDENAARAVLSAVIAEREPSSAPRLDLVWTGPEAAGTGSRDTGVVVRQLFRDARESVLICGFYFDHGKEILRPLHEVMKTRGVKATIVLDIPGRAESEQDMHAFAEAEVCKFFDTNWTFGEPRPLMFYDPRTVTPDSWVSMHAKCIVVDEDRTLLTSANFTQRAQQRNIEAGVLIDDQRFARLVRQQWLGLIEARLLRQVDALTEGGG